MKDLRKNLINLFTSHTGRLYSLLMVVMSSHLCSLAQDSGYDSLASKEMTSVLTDKVLHVWYPTIIDTVYGGFYTNFAYDWKKMPVQEKMIVTQARDIWTASKAAERFPKDKRYLKASSHGFNYLANTMWDKKNGGFYTTIMDKSHTPSKDCKNAYGNSFAIYALAAYYKVSHRPEVLHLAKRAFHWLDSAAHDSRYGGYFNTLCKSSEASGFLQNGAPNNLKDFNSSIHVMEALAELYQVWPDKLLKSRLTEMLTLIRDTFATPKGYLQLYFTADWKHISLRDSSENKVRQQIYMDHVSFGHDIETAFLLLEASKSLGLKNDTVTLRQAKRMIDHTMAHGFDKNFRGIFDGGFYFKGSDTMTIVMRDKNWWSQAEGLNALLLFSKLYPQEKSYKQAFFLLWDYVKKNLVDFEHGDWYSSGLDSAPFTKMQPKASAWKCNYHTSRALLNCIAMLDGKDILQE